jgi:hypothetical protein
MKLKLNTPLLARYLTVFIAYMILGDAVLSSHLKYHSSEGPSDTYCCVMFIYISFIEVFAVCPSVEGKNI